MSNEISKRSRAIKDHISALQIIKSEIRFKNTPLKDIMSLIEKNCTADTSVFYKKTYELACEGMTFASAALENYSFLRREGLANEDIEILRQVYLSLGRYDGETQTEALDRGVEALKNNLIAVKKDSLTKGRLYRAVSAAAGMILLLMIV